MYAVEHEHLDDEHEETCPKCASADIILAELDYRGCKSCGHWWLYGDNPTE